jgi:hypothetical protein
MSISPDQLFYRRVDLFGTHISFCRRSFQTVAKGRREADLEDGERAHKRQGPQTPFGPKKPNGADHPFGS